MAKKPNSHVPGDVPKKLMQHFPAEFATVAAKIFNAILRKKVYPTQWKIEYGIPIEKWKNPVSEENLRVISKTAFLSKIFEAFVVEWLLGYIKPFLDPNQFGGLKGISVNHYLIKFLEFVHKSLDVREPSAVLATMVDLSKAFNRVDHNLVIEDLYNMNCPSWLLNIVFSYLSDRTLNTM